MLSNVSFFDDKKRLRAYVLVRSTSCPHVHASSRVADGQYFKIINKELMRVSDASVHIDGSPSQQNQIFC